jgi:autotransporter strand-loop-strand O-heptosyltransferase
MYKIGWYYNESGDVNYFMNPFDFKKASLQKTASDILGLDFEQIRPKLNIPTVEKKRRVGLGINSTAQTKYWNNPTGWLEITNFLRLIGYEVVILSKEGDGYMNNFYPKGASKLTEGSINQLIEFMSSCEIFIGIGSGLSWLAWSLNIPTVLISGFSTPISEFTGEGVVRIFNEDVCNGCYNRYKFDAGDWNWCPDHKGTNRQFECTKSITGGQVINRLISDKIVSFL